MTGARISLAGLSAVPAVHVSRARAVSTRTGAHARRRTGGRGGGPRVDTRGTPAHTADRMAAAPIVIDDSGAAAGRIAVIAFLVQKHVAVRRSVVALSVQIHVAIRRLSTMDDRGPA